MSYFKRIWRNDVGDSDAGPNGYLNFPVINSAIQEGTKITVNLGLDAAGTTDPNGLYRVELFANDTPDPSGYGEGQIYLGYAMVINGDNQNIEFTIPSGIDLTGKALSATTTAMNSSTSSGFGSTSEFSLVSEDITVIVPDTPDPNGGGSDNGAGSLADTGQGSRLAFILGLSIVSAALITTMFDRKYSSIAK